MEIPTAGDRRIFDGVIMRKWLKGSISFFLVPFTRWYLRKKRNYTYKGIPISVFPGVFHPGLFSSTHFMLAFLEGKSIKNSTLLELGCGTGLISIVSAKAGALVTACELSLVALKNAEHNIRQNRVSVQLIHSNLFDAIEKKTFDWIIINPPYYAKVVRNEEDLAWHCGDDFQYFHKLFSTLRDCIHPNTQVIMVLTLGCEQDKIFEIARRHLFVFELIGEKNVLFDGKDFLYRITH